MSADQSSITQLALSYFYFVPFTVCLVAALFVLSQATIVVMFGPTMALKGSTDEAVKFAAAQMMNQQFIILKAAMVSITGLFIGACVLSWANYPIGIAVITTVVYIIAYYIMLKEGQLVTTIMLSNACVVGCAICCISRFVNLMLIIVTRTTQHAMFRLQGLLHLRAERRQRIRGSRRRHHPEHRAPAAAEQPR